MSLETVIEQQNTLIQDNTAAIRELISAIRAGVPTTAEQVAAVAGQAVQTGRTSGAEAQTSTKPSPAAASTGGDASDLAGGKTGQQAVDALNGIANVEHKATYDDVSNTIKALGKVVPRAQVVALLAEFKVQKGPELLPAQYDAFVARAAEVEAAAKTATAGAA